MPEFHELEKEARIARVGADRMAAGLNCIPNKIRGDLDEVLRLHEKLAQIVAVCDDNATVGNTALALKFVREVATTK